MTIKTRSAGLQALGSDDKGTTLFLGLGTSLGTALIADGVVVPMELGHPPCRHSSFEDHVGEHALRGEGKKKWRQHVLDVVAGKALRAPARDGSANRYRARRPLGLLKEDATMQLGMIGLGRMGANMVRRLMQGGHVCAVFDRSPEAVAAMAQEGTIGAASLAELVARLDRPRAVWLMVPAAAVDQNIGALLPLLAPGDALIDGGNSHYVDSIRRARELAPHEIDYVDVGTSGGVWGLERGYCLMIGGPDTAVQRLDPVFRTLAPGLGSIDRTPGRAQDQGTAELGYLHCGASGAGHFVKMVHNGIEYGLMAAYAEGMGILKGANVGGQRHDTDADATPLRDPRRPAYDLNLADIAELWRRGSVISSWLLDLTAAALADDPTLAGFDGRVSDSGEGRWTIQVAIDEGVPAPVLSSALYARFASRGEAGFQDRLLSALRWQFGGHREQRAGA